MDSFKRSAEWMLNNKKVIGYILIAVFFAVVAQQLYTRYLNSNTNSQYEGYSNASSDSGADNNHPVAVIRMFKVDWCPHCKKALPEFQAVQNQHNGKVVNGHKLNFVVVDGEDPANESMVNDFKIQGYPTVVLTKNGKNIEYDAKVDQPTLQKFINTMV
jgi:thiol-disulfide isomerase/thioredoxin